MAEVSTDVFGTNKDGETVNRFTLKNGKGMSVNILEYGGVIQEINVPDKNGKISDVTLGFDNVKNYETYAPWLIGALCGRVTNRIAGAQFTLDGKTIELVKNDVGGFIHGGTHGFNERMWKGEVKDGKVTVTYVSPDGEENFPGELTTKVTYSLGKDENSLILEYEATTTKPTILNLTNHAYFNLAGHAAGHVNDHLVTLQSDGYVKTDENLIPTGEIGDVSNTIYDLRKPVRIGDVIKDVPGGKGFDNVFSLKYDGKLSLAARLDHPDTGRYLECYTTEPALILYTSYYLPEGMVGKEAAEYKQYGFVCLEAVHFPDSIHHDNFPTVVLRPGETYRQTTVYKFGIAE